MSEPEYSELIEKYRTILNDMIKNNKPFDDIYKISLILDELINSYMIN